MSLSDSVAQAKKSFSEFLEKDSTWDDKKLFDFKISISPHVGKSAGLGIDTTKLYSQLKPAQQYGHNVKMVPLQPNRSSRYYYGDHMRKGRQQDVVVSAVSEMTERRWRADMKNNTIVLSINLAPTNVRKKQKDKLINDLNELLKLVSSPPEVEIPE